MYEKIKERYGKNYIRDDQLTRYVALGVITAEQAAEIANVKMENNPIIRGGGVSREHIAAHNVAGLTSADLTIRLPGGIHLILRDAGSCQ